MRLGIRSRVAELGVGEVNNEIKQTLHLISDNTCIITYRDLSAGQ